MPGSEPSTAPRAPSAGPSPEQPPINPTEGTSHPPASPSPYPVKIVLAEAVELLRVATDALQNSPSPLASNARAQLEVVRQHIHDLASTLTEFERSSREPPIGRPRSDRHQSNPLAKPFFRLVDSVSKAKDLLAVVVPDLPARSPQALPTTQVRPPIPIPTGPVIRGALQAIYAGNHPSKWVEDVYGRPHCPYDAKDGHISLFFDSTPDPGEAMLALWKAVRAFSVETADVFLILMSRIAQLQDPARDIARIRMDDIASDRDVRLRYGNAWKLHQAFQHEILRLADIRLTMVWKDYKRGGTVTFGKPLPDRLLDIVGVEYEKDSEIWTGFSYRCGQAMAHFLSPGGLRWIGHYSRALLRLNPYHEALTKKIGTYWILTGTAAATHGQTPRATPRSLLEFCGEEPNSKFPNRTVDRLIEAHRRLHEIGLLATLPDLEPPNRRRGYFKRWLDTPLTTSLPETIPLANLNASPGPFPSPRKRRVSRRASRQLLLPFHVPGSPQALQADPTSIRQFRIQHNLHQSELAHTLGITRETLSRYERGIRRPSDELATRIWTLWHRKDHP